MANWQLRVVLPTLVRVARESAAPNHQLEVIIAEMVTMARARGLESTLAELERENDRYLARIGAARNDNGPAVAGPSPAVHAPQED